MTPTEMHDEAMIQFERGNVRGALDLERAAAAAETSEPSRAILYRSAAWLALDAGDPAEALRLAEEGLRHAGPGMACQLRDAIRAASLGWA